MRAETQAAFIDAVRLFRESTNMGKITKAMSVAWSKLEKDIASAHGGPLDGSNYNPADDDERLKKQLGRVFVAMSDGKWHTLRWIAKVTGDPQSSVSADLRHLRKQRHGSWIIDKRNKGGGLFLYRMRNPDGTALPPILAQAHIPNSVQPAFT